MAAVGQPRRRDFPLPARSNLNRPSKIRRPRPRDPESDTGQRWPTSRPSLSRIHLGKFLSKFLLRKANPEGSCGDPNQEFRDYDEF
ncbi:hypothetical protein U9M48_024912 [Paspalum notatum var. saurae]|uniref:Uncharacterized protein n=1 Tax=Paspalum notatum var. saurae TaxID=547442 RepID=A0AAQ3WWL6_PASNO